MHVVFHTDLVRHLSHAALIHAFGDGSLNLLSVGIAGRATRPSPPTVPGTGPPGVPGPFRQPPFRPGRAVAAPGAEPQGFPGAAGPVERARGG
jgi:hypothetical protein